MQQECFSDTVGASLIWPAFFVLRFPARHFLKLVGQDDSSPFCFLTWMSRLASDQVGILEGVPLSQSCSATSMLSNIVQVSLQVFSSKYQPCRSDCLARSLGTERRRIQLSSSISIFLEAYDTGKSGRKLLIYVNLTAKRQKDMLQGLRIARLIARFCFENTLTKKKYPSKPSWISFRWILVAPPY